MFDIGADVVMQISGKCCKAGLESGINEMQMHLGREETATLKFIYLKRSRI